MYIHINSLGAEKRFSLAFFYPLTYIALYGLSCQPEGLTLLEDLCLLTHMKWHHAHTTDHILLSVLVAGDISRMSTSPPSEPRHTKGPLCFQVLMWKADGK